MRHGLFDTRSGDEHRVNWWSTVLLYLRELKEASGVENKSAFVW